MYNCSLSSLQSYEISKSIQTGTILKTKCQISIKLSTGRAYPMTPIYSSATRALCGAYVTSETHFAWLSESHIIVWKAYARNDINIGSMNFFIYTKIFISFYKSINVCKVE